MSHFSYYFILEDSSYPSPFMKRNSSTLFISSFVCSLFQNRSCSPAAKCWVQSWLLSLAVGWNRLVFLILFSIGFSFALRNHQFAYLSYLLFFSCLHFVILVRLIEVFVCLLNFQCFVCFSLVQPCGSFLKAVLTFLLISCLFPSIEYCNCCFDLKIGPWADLSFFGNC